MNGKRVEGGGSVGSQLRVWGADWWERLWLTAVKRIRNVPCKVNLGGEEGKC